MTDRETQGAKPTWKSYPDYLNASSSSFESFRQRRLSPSQLNVAVAEQTRAFSDDATPDLNIQLLLDGEVDIANCDMGFGRSSFRGAAGSFIVVPPFAELSLDGSGDFRLATVSLPWIQLQSELNLLADREIKDFGAVHKGVSSDVLTVALIRNLVRANAESEVAADSIFSMIVARLLELSKSAKPSSLRRPSLSANVLSRLTEFIHTNMETGVSLDSLAQITGFSRFHFCRAFKASTGFTPNEYLIRLRVEYAREHVKRGGSLTDIALKSGFADQSHMTRLFKRVYGLTPGRFQSEMGSKVDNTSENDNR